jgi:hypothetical protein
MGVGWPIEEGGSARCDLRDLVAEPSEQFLMFVAADVEIANDVERTVLYPPVVPERNALEVHRFNLLGSLHHEDVSKPLVADSAERPPHLRGLVADVVRTEGSIGPVSAPILAEPFGHIEHDNHGQSTVLPRQFHLWLAGLGLNIGSVDDRQSTQGQQLPCDEPEHFEGVLRHGLIVLVVTYSSVLRA